MTFSRVIILVWNILKLVDIYIEYKLKIDYSTLSYIAMKWRVYWKGNPFPREQQKAFKARKAFIYKPSAVIELLIPECLSPSWAKKDASYLVLGNELILGKYFLPCPVQCTVYCVQCVLLQDIHHTLLHYRTLLTDPA